MMQLEITTKVYWGSRSIAPLIHSALEGVCDQHHAPAALSRYSLNRKLRDTHSRSGGFNRLYLPGLEPRTVQLVA
jgi:hypothetical protein